MDGDEQVRLQLAVRGFDPFAQRHIVVARADQDSAHPRHRIDLTLDLPRDGQHDLLLEYAADADGAWVLAAMAGVDGNHHVAFTFRCPNGWRARIAHRFDRVQVDDQAVPVGGNRSEHQLLGRRRPLEVQHHAVVVACAPG